MSEPRLISPMLDNFIMGGPISEHHGVQCCPAMENETDDRYIVKIISVPATPAQMDALLLSGAYQDEASALAYFKALADGVVDEVKTLKMLSELEGFIPYSDCQVEIMESGKGYDIYLLRSYMRNLEKHFKRHSMTHLDALNLGLDLCAALSVCRRSGFLYVDLKPSNVFVTDGRVFHIGDLGFIRLDSLKYASIPEKYLSVYTPPEISDAFSALNSTMDTYAAGLILYQAYNNGALPFNDELLPGDRLPAPLYADYEMSEIILKACSPNPEERWQDPMQMGQAIVSYMQRNGAKDMPIVPMPSAAPAEEETKTPPREAQTEDAITEPEAAAAPEHKEEAPADIAAYAEDEFGNLSFLDDISYEDLDMDEDAEGYEAVTEEVSEMLEQADELAALDVPDPVVVPEHIDLPEPEPIAQDEAQPQAEEADAEEEDFEEDQDEPELDEEDEDAFTVKPVKPKTRWLRYCILVLVVLGLLSGGYFFYKYYYLLPINSISVDGQEDTLTVFIDTDIDESLLFVYCSDTYGNQLSAPVIDGKAEFTELVPNTAYAIKVVADGFHKIVGTVTTAYSTPIQTNIVQFDAVTGITDGSVILSFAVEGPDCKEWSVLYHADGEEVRTATFTSHMVTLTDLTVGKEYTFRLVPDGELYVTGQSEILFASQKLVRAENLQIVSCMNSALTAKWTVPEGASVSSWSVRCFNDTYTQTVITTDTSVTFHDLDHTAAYTVEVKAVGMSISQAVSIPANSVTASNMKADTSDPTRLVFSWQSSTVIPEDGWIMKYTIAGIDVEEIVLCDNNTAVISPIVPNATYRVRLEDVSGNMLLSSAMEITTGVPTDFYEEFDGFNVSRSELEFSMCKTPNVQNWDKDDLSTDDYKTTFAAGEAASFLVRIRKTYSATTENLSTLYVVRKEDGTLIHTAQTNNPWRDMWYKNYCELNIPVMPSDAGNYTIEVYFNGGLAHTQTFSIT